MWKKKAQIAPPSGGPFTVSNGPNRTMNTSANWAVDNWQIPVPVGDCSVHLLVDESKAKGEAIINAFIMDGGKKSDGLTPQEQILRALAAIDEARQNWTWTFDAWVVTHWDEDHYAGLLALWSGNLPVTRNNVEQGFREAYFKEKKPLLYCGGPKPDHITVEDFRIMGPDKNLLLGLDIFTGKHMFDANGKIPLTAPAQPDQPRFCIVGANGVVAGKPNFVYKKEKVISKNETSILAVVYWPGTGGGKVSYFTGGDGNPDAETKGLVPFLENNSSAQLPRGFVNMVKLDHHGSSKENLDCPDLTKTLLNLLKPVHILVTPGNQYGHPTWDVLYYVFDYIKGIQNSNGSGPGKLYTTRSPYWLNTQYGSGLNVGHYRLLGQLFEEHRALEDEDDENSHSDNTLQRTFAEQKRAMKEAVKEYQEEAKAFKQGLPIYVPKNTSRQQKPVAIGGKKKKKADEKPYWYVASKVEEYCAEVQRNLAAAYEGCDNKEEPESDEFLAALLTMRNFQELIREILRDLWAKMSDQEIIVAGNPYWLIRFTFGDGGKKTIVVPYDDDGADNKPLDRITPAQYADPTTLANIQDAKIKNYVTQNFNRACFELSPLNFMNNLALFKGDEQLGAMGTNTQWTFNLPARPRKQSADLLGGFADRFSGFAGTAAQPQETSTMSFFDDLAESEDVGLGNLRDLDYHIIPNDGNGLLCGIFALHDSIEHQIPATDIPAGRGPTDEELYDEALRGAAAQVLHAILPDELHTRNFTSDHLASVLEHWGRRAGVVKPLRLGIVFQDGKQWLMPIDQPPGSPEPQTIWIEHQGDRHGNGGHYSGIAPGKPDETRQTRVTREVAKARMAVEAKLKLLARDNQFMQSRLTREDLSDPESLGTRAKRLEEEEKRREVEKKRREKGQLARKAVEKSFSRWNVSELRAMLKAEGVKGYSKLLKKDLIEALVNREMEKQGLAKPLTTDGSEDETISSEASSESEELVLEDRESDDEDDQFNDNPYRRTDTAELLKRLNSLQFRKQQKKKEEDRKKQQVTTAAAKKPGELLHDRPDSEELKDLEWGEKKKLKVEKGLNDGPKRRSKKKPKEMDEEDYS